VLRDALLADLRRLVGADAVLTDEAARLAAGTDFVTRRGVPGAVARPRSGEQVAALVGFAAAEVATRETIDAGGWLHTGDIVRVDPDGWFHVVDRVKELIKVNGRQVAPAEIEHILLTHPAVAGAAVIGYPDEKAGELPKAFVVLHRAVEQSALIAYVADRVSPHKQIRRLEVVDEIPRSPTGKILRRLLVERERTPSYAFGHEWAPI
jgi:acyl-coenzyme A synthetase/AMP-(fatty) acid ligase